MLVEHARHISDYNVNQVNKITTLRKQTAADALKHIQGDEALVEELLDWTSETLAWLASTEHNSTPEDLVTADALLREHLVGFHSLLFYR